MQNFGSKLKSYMTDPALILTILVVGAFLGTIFVKLVKKVPVVGNLAKE